MRDYITTDATFRELSVLHGYSGLGAANLYNRFIGILYANGSEAFKARFNLEELDFKKPRSERTRDKMSAARGGDRKRVKELVRVGITDFHQVAEALNISEDRAQVAFRSLRKAGKAPESRVSQNARLAIRLENANGNLEIAKVLPEVTYWFYRTHRAMFVGVSELARAEGYIFRDMDTRFFVHALKKQGIPMRVFDPKEIRANSDSAPNLLLSQQRREAAIALELSNDLKRFRLPKSVVQVAGVLEMPKRINDFDDKEKYVRCYSQLCALGLTRRQIRVNIRHCNLRVYNKSGYVVKKEDYDALMEWGNNLVQRLNGFDQEVAAD
ncbi:MAG: hypothetical protein WD988_00795 [Candidatus Curtissbacteria bacterium]